MYELQDLEYCRVNWDETNLISLGECGIVI